MPTTKTTKTSVKTSVTITSMARPKSVKSAASKNAAEVTQNTDLESKIQPSAANKLPAKTKSVKSAASKNAVEIKEDIDVNDEIKDMIRLSKLIADRGYCSRRKAEELIKQGLVSLNGQTVKSVAMLAKAGDKIDFAKQAKTLETETSNAHLNKQVGKNTDATSDEVKLYALYKPVGYLVTESEEEGKKNIYSLIPRSLGRLIYIGRLDVNSEGLLLLTNSGDFARKMTLPANKIVREYRVRAYGFFDEKKIKRMSKGVMIDGVSYKPEKLELERAQINKIGVASNIWFKIWLSTGKNREIRKLFEHFNLQVSRLIRISYGTVSLQSLKHGEIMQINPHKVAKIAASFENLDK